jgi:hypothetical protein
LYLRFINRYRSFGYNYQYIVGCNRDISDCYCNIAGNCINKWVRYCNITDNYTDFIIRYSNIANNYILFIKVFIKRNELAETNYKLQSVNYKAFLSYFILLLYLKLIS